MLILREEEKTLIKLLNIDEKEIRYPLFEPLSNICNSEIKKGKRIVLYGASEAGKKIGEHLLKKAFI